MAFVFNWPRFSDQFHADARLMLENALNKGSKPPIIADKIEVVELEMGTQPPELEIRDIGELTMDQFRGIFRLSYSGDAYIVLRTKVQANPLIHKKRDMNLIDSTRGMVAAQAPLVVPMNLRLSNFKLNSYVVLVVSKQKGITLVFKTDPLQNVDVNSTFDRIGVIQKYIQKEIEGQLREMFREDLPSIIHKLSQRWFSRELSSRARVEVPYARKFQHQPPEYDTTGDDSNGSLVAPIYPSHPPLPREYSHARSSSSYSYTYTESAPRSTPARTPSITSSISTGHTPSSAPSTFPDIENYDPTYGLRPEELPAKSDYSTFAKLWHGPTGLGELAEQEEGPDGDIEGAEVEWESEAGMPMQPWDDGSYWAPSVDEPAVDYETVYAVGGGTVTRPRILHSQSLIQTGSSDTATVRSGMTPRIRMAPLPPPRMNSIPLGLRIHTGPPSTSSTPIPMALGARPTPLSLSSSYFQGWDNSASRSEVGPSSSRPLSARPSFSALSDTPPSPFLRPRPIPPYLTLSKSTPSCRRITPPESVHHRSAQHTAPVRPSRSSSGLTYSGSTPPSSEVPPTEAESEADVSASPSSAKSFQARRSSISQRLYVGSPPRSEYGSEGRGPIVLKPAMLNATVSHLSVLSNSHHTLSPYTRSMQHYAVRSGPPKVPSHATRSAVPVAGERQPVKGRRKRTYYIGGAKDPDPEPGPGDSVSVAGEERSPSPRPASDYSEYFHVSPVLDADSGVRHRAPYAAQ